MWAGTLLTIRNLHLPSLEGLFDSLVGLLKKSAIDTNLKTELGEARLMATRLSQTNTINQENVTPLNTAIKKLLTKIAGKDFTVTIRNSNYIEKKTNTWPGLILDILSGTEHIKIGIGSIGHGHHIEIIGTPN